MRYVLLLVFSFFTFQGNARSPPCCRDMIGSVACTRQYRNNRVSFSDKCNQNIEFRLLQCCSTCNKSPDTFEYDSIVPQLLAEDCQDRYGEAFCDRNSKQLYDNQRLDWCDEKRINISFRICRKFCNYCGQNSTINYTLEAAVNACSSHKYSSNKRGVMLGMINVLPVFSTV
uniref:ShKT domain-containing protein n=1 Tax=Rhabditophanes sp. KR3021 TaxID=114890 RepID=A0AC35TZP1_9BILA